EREREREGKSGSNSRSSHWAIKMKARHEIPGKVIVILSPFPPEPVPVPAHDDMCFFNGNADCFLSGVVENKERMHNVITPRPNFFPRTYAKVVARVKRTHVVYELCTAGIEVPETYIIQHSSREIDLLPKPEDGRL